MAAQLRWILLALSLALLAGIWWWGRRRSSQAPGDAQLREIAPPTEARKPPEPRQAAESRDGPAFREPSASREASASRESSEAREAAVDAAETDTAPSEDPKDRAWGVPPFEPLSIHTQDFDHVPVLDGPMMVNPDTVIAPVPAAAAAAAPTASKVTPGRVPTLSPESADRGTGAAAQVPNASEQQKIVTLRVCAPGEARWSGATLLSALELHGLAYGRHQVFHRRHVDGRSLFCVASLVEPGTFDVARMSSEEFRGVTLFAVLPGPVEPLLTIDELIGAARGLAQELSGMVQDHKGMPLSPQRAAALRDDVARFQAALPRA
ncbi:MAG TPA: cell division protein ZipA C-terminal FtsZ-binding domain-containing protein [Steroidobacteraceae bacterium]|jgi:cell division protein ZipA|nr:cell division protein ZipA C-terminal FtsZ-binding domain-containing protein [Steroidobacteraceae bacterium]